MAIRSNQETALKLSFVTGTDKNNREVVESRTIRDFDASTSDDDLLAAGSGLAGLYRYEREGIYRVDTCVLKAA